MALFIIKCAFFLLFTTLVIASSNETPQIREHIILENVHKSKDSILFIIFLGDYELTFNKYNAMDDSSKNQLFSFLKYVNGRGFVIVNFEMLLPRSDIFAIEYLAKNGVDAAIIANNHSCDHGTEFIIETEKQLLQHGIQPIGTFDNPYLHYFRNGMSCNIIALANKLDKECIGMNRLNTAQTDTNLLHLNSMPDPFIVVLHDGGPSKFISDYEELKAKYFLEKGAVLTILMGGHIVKGYKMYDGKLALYSLGNFILHWRSEKEYISIVPIIGFDKNKISYFSIIPFYDECGKKFRLLNGNQYNKAIEIFTERSMASNKMAYVSNESKKFILESISNILKGKTLTRLRPKHLFFLIKYIYYNYLIYVLVIFVIACISIIYIKKRVTSYSKKQ